MLRASLLLLSACGRFGFSDTGGGGTGGDGGPADELGLSLDAVISGDGIAAPACGATVLLADGFDVAGAAPEFKTYTDTGLTLREMNSRFEVAFAASVADGHYAGYKSATSFPTDGLCATVRVAQAAASNGLQFFKLTSGVQQVEWAIYQGSLGARTHLNKAVGTVISIPFDPVAHAYLRMRQQAGTTYWDVSTDGVAFTVVASTMFVTDPSLSYELGAGAFGNASNAGVAAFDDAVLTAP